MEKLRDKQKKAKEYADRRRAKKLAEQTDAQRAAEEAELASKAAEEEKMRKALARQAEEKKKFEEAEARLKEAASAAIAENFKNSLANAKLSEAVKSGDPQLIEQAAARKLQSQWCV